MKPARIAGVLLVAAAACGCSRLEPWVKPYERENIADPIMAWDSRPGLLFLHAARLRVARGRARRSGRERRGLRMQLIRAAVVALALLPLPAAAAVLADDRADFLYHYYDGGGVTIDGPSLLVRKKFAEKYAVNASYYMDMVSSASIDVITTASPYTRSARSTASASSTCATRSPTRLRSATRARTTTKRTPRRSRSARTCSATSRPFRCSSAAAGTTSPGAAMRTFADQVDRRIYGVDISQVATKNMVLGLAYETVTEEGFLNNPYRQVRYLDPEAARGFSFEPERYPRTRTGNAVSLRARYFLPYRAAIQGEYRFYTDTWEILGHTAEVSYTHPLDEELDIRRPLPLLHAGRRMSSCRSSRCVYETSAVCRGLPAGGYKAVLARGSRPGTARECQRARSERRCRCGCVGSARVRRRSRAQPRGRGWGGGGKDCSGTPLR